MRRKFHVVLEMRVFLWSTFHLCDQQESCQHILTIGACFSDRQAGRMAGRQTDRQREREIQEGRRIQKTHRCFRLWRRSRTMEELSFVLRFGRVYRKSCFWDIRYSNGVLPKEKKSINVNNCQFKTPIKRLLYTIGWGILAASLPHHRDKMSSLL